MLTQEKIEKVLYCLVLAHLKDPVNLDHFSDCQKIKNVLGWDGINVSIAEAYLIWSWHSAGWDEDWLPITVSLETADKILEVAQEFVTKMSRPFNLSD